MQIKDIERIYYYLRSFYPLLKLKGDNFFLIKI